MESLWVCRYVYANSTRLLRVIPIILNLCKLRVQTGTLFRTSSTFDAFSTTVERTFCIINSGTYEHPLVLVSLSQNCFEALPVCIAYSLFGLEDPTLCKGGGVSRSRGVLYAPLKWTC